MCLAFWGPYFFCDVAGMWLNEAGQSLQVPAMTIWFDASCID